MNSFDASLSRFSPVALTAFRVVFGLLFALRGTQKLFGWPLGAAVPVGTWPLWWAGLIEVVTGLLIAVGLFTRIAAFIASGHMAVAYFWMHFPKGFWPYPVEGGNGGEVTILYCFGFLLLATMGAGVYAVDARRRSTAGTGTVGRRNTTAPRQGRAGGWRNRFSRRA